MSTSDSGTLACFVAACLAWIAWATTNINDLTVVPRLSKKNGFRRSTVCTHLCADRGSARQLNCVSPPLRGDNGVRHGVGHLELGSLVGRNSCRRASNTSHSKVFRRRGGCQLLRYATHWAVDVFFFANVFTMQHLPCIHVRAHLEGITDRYAKLRYPILTPCAAAARHVPSDATPGTGITTKRDHAHARTVAALGHSGPKTRG